MSWVTVVAHVLVLVLSGAVTTRLAVVAWRRRDRPGAYPFVGLMAAASIWSFAYAAGLLTATHDVRVFWEQVQWFGIAFVPLYLLLFFAEYTGFDGLQRTKSVLALAAVPLATLVLVWTNHWHSLVWQDTTLVHHAGLTFAEQDFGPWYWVNLLYTYLLTGGGVFVLLYAIRESRGTFRARLVLLLVGIAVPFVANLSSILDYQLVQGMDMTPYVFWITGLAFSRAVFDYGLFDRTPSVLQLGQLYALDDLRDAVVVADTAGSVALYNETAVDVFDDPNLLDAAIDALLPAVPAPGDDPLVVDVDDRTFEVGASAVTDASDRGLGTTYLLHDVTRREAHLAELESNRAKLERQRTELLELDALNGTLRSINQALVNSRTATEVAENVTNQLRTTRWYDDATITPDRVTEPTVWTADGVDDVTAKGEGATTSEEDATTSGEGTTTSGEDATATADVESAAVDAVASGPASGPASGDGGEDVAVQYASVPIRFGPADYGSLRVRTDRPRAFGDRELSVLAELGQTTGLALNAIETRDTLLSDTVVELTYRFDGAEALASVTGAVECALSVSSTVPLDEETSLAYVDVAGTGGDDGRGTMGDDGRDTTGDDDVDVDAVADAFAGCDDVVAVKRVPNRDTVELRVGETSPFVVAAGRGANVVSATAVDGVLELVAETASGADVRTLTEALEAATGSVELAGKRERAPVEAAAANASDANDAKRVDAGLTGRQAESLESAHDAGYFGWPRDSTAEDVADAMGIAPSTFHSHLRKAQGKLVAWYVDETDQE